MPSVLGPSGTVVCGRCRVATTAPSRGLLGRARLDSGEGLLLVPARSIHTAFMRCAIDVVFLDRELRVLRVVSELVPWRVAGCRGARAALELAAGEGARLGLSLGERLRLATGTR